MRAYNFMALMLCIGVGVTLMFASNLFHVSAGGYSLDLDDIYVSLFLWGGLAAVGGFALATGASALLPGGGAQTGVSYSLGAFGAVYWAVWGVVKTLLSSLVVSFEGFDYIWIFITVIAVLVFFIALIQMSSGGMKSHV